jgi:TRAP transporter TAXI family solute receptor
VPGLIAVAQASSGSVENINAIRAGEIESGFSQADIAFWGYTGTGLFQEAGAMGELRAIARLYSELVHIVVPADSDIHTIADLAGHRVSLGEEGSGTLIDMRILLKAHGLSETDIEPVYLRPDRSGDLLIKGELDAFAIIGGTPLPAVADLARRLPIRLLPIEDAAVGGLIADYPFFVPAAFEEGIYEGVSAVPTIAVGAIWVTTTAVDEETVYGIARALWHPSTLALLKGGHPRGAEIVLEKALQGLGIPLHPGAERFYGEEGLPLPAQAAEEAHPPPG